jgi:hypothetical protein
MRVFCLLFLFTILMPASSQRVRGEPPAVRDTASTPGHNESDRLPAGTIRRGTLANNKLVHDAQMGVAAACATMSLEAPTRVDSYVVQDPVGAPGSCCWREKWIVMDKHRRYGEITFRFEEDGRGGAFWTVEEASRLPGEVVLHDTDAAMQGAAAVNAVAKKDQAVQADIESYRRVAEIFVASAKGGDADAMVAVTSLLTIVNEGGAEPMMSQYIERFLPKFKEAKVTWDDTFELMTDDTGNRGVEIRCLVEGKRAFPLYLWVMKEGGKHVVTGVSIKRYADLLIEKQQ